MEKPGRKPMGVDRKKRIVAVTLDPPVIDWLREWAAHRDRSLSWCINHFCKERRNQDLAEKHFGKRVVR